MLVLPLLSRLGEILQAKHVDEGQRTQVPLIRIDGSAGAVGAIPETTKWSTNQTPNLAHLLLLGQNLHACFVRNILLRDLDLYFLNFFR